MTRPPDELVQNALARLVVGDEVFYRVALGCRVLGMAPDVQVQPGTVLEKDVGGPAPTTTRRNR